MEAAKSYTKEVPLDDNDDDDDDDDVILQNLLLSYSIFDCPQRQNELQYDSLLYMPYSIIFFFGSPWSPSILYQLIFRHRSVISIVLCPSVYSFFLAVAARSIASMRLPRLAGGNGGSLAPADMARASLATAMGADFLGATGACAPRHKTSLLCSNAIKNVVARHVASYLHTSNYEHTLKYTAKLACKCNVSS